MFRAWYIQGDDAAIDVVVSSQCGHSLIIEFQCVYGGGAGGSPAGGY